MMKAAAVDTQAELERRIVAASLSWEPLKAKANLEGLPSCVPRGHRITFFKYLLNGLLTTARLRFIDEVIVRDCPFCGLDSCDDRQRWVTCSVLKSIFRELYEGNTALVMDQAYENCSYFSLSSMQSVNAGVSYYGATNSTTTRTS